MKILDRLDRLVRPIVIPNLTMTIIVLQVVVFLAAAADPGLLERAALRWSDVMAGQVWRLITFMMIPPATNPLFLFFALYLFHLMGSALEQTWGTVRYNLFFYLGYLLTVASAAVAPERLAVGLFLQGSIFLAFATYFPRFELRLFLILPVQIRWLAYLQALGYGVVFFAGDLAAKMMITAALGNYIIFFAPMLFHKAKAKQRKIQWESKQVKINPNKPRHTCAACGIDSNKAPEMDFRYCSKCGGEYAYCSDHLRDHEHKEVE